LESPDAECRVQASTRRDAVCAAQKDKLMPSKHDNANVRIPPPLLYLGVLLLTASINNMLKIGGLGLDRLFRLILGLLLLFSGVVVAATARGLFKKLGTNVPPWQPATLLVTSGMFRWSRNPMYVGLTLAYTGLAMLLNSVIALAFLPLVLVIMRTQVIAKEERYLEAKFGDRYQTYKAEVRRWV
jgi:protein-S-isoprenylcysteine O-methyltransferase Ste14